MTSRVFVPLVDAKGEAAHLFEAIAGEVPPEAHPARLVPQIAELFDFGLYGVGQTAREAVQSFIEARRSRLWLSPRNSSLKPWHLRISDLQLGRLSEGNARSAGLGLTVAALLQAFGRDPGAVFATGEILPASAPGAGAAGIGAVSGMRGKLALIGDYLSQHGPALEGQRVVVALPALADDGQPLEQAERGLLDRLRAEAKGARIKLDIVFADTLDALEPALGPFTIPEFVTRARAFVAACVLTVAAVGLGVWSLLAHAPIRLAFEPPGPPSAGASGPDEAAPQRARYDAKSDKLELLGPCFDAQRQPLVVGGETLVLKVRAQDAIPFASRVRPMRLFIASVSRSADPVILDAAHFRTLGTESLAGDLVAAIPIEATEDEVRLFVLATRDPKLAISEVETALRATLKGLTGAATLAATTTFLADRVGAEIVYQFRVTNDPKACA